MKIMERKLDRRFLKYLYKDKVNEINDVFEVFIKKIPRSLCELHTLVQEKRINPALDKINEVAPEFNAIGLPYLAVKLQTVGVYLDFLKLQDAQISLQEFEQELRQYIPIIMQEYSRLIAYRNNVSMRPLKQLT